MSSGYVPQPDTTVEEAFAAGYIAGLRAGRSEVVAAILKGAEQEPVQFTEDPDHGE